MNAAGLDISFTGQAEAPDCRCTLEAEIPPHGANNPTPGDLAAMLARAQSGQSARTYQMESCPAASFREDGTLIVSLAVYVWPSLPDLPYTLYLPDEAVAGEITIHRRQRQWKFWADGAGTLSLPWRLEDVVLSWQDGIPCMDAHCNVVAEPALRHEHARVFVPADVYGVIVAQGAACGFRHGFSVGLGKLDADGKPQVIDLDAVPVSVSWTDAEGEEQSAEVSVPIPACAKALLTACSDGRGVFRGRVRRADGGRWEVAYSACDGSVLGIRFVNGNGGSGND